MVLQARIVEPRHGIYLLILPLVTEADQAQRRHEEDIAWPGVAADIVERGRTRLRTKPIDRHEADERAACIVVSEDSRAGLQSIGAE
jgi:hypothetical protein